MYLFDRMVSLLSEASILPRKGEAGYDPILRKRASNLVKSQGRLGYQRGGTAYPSGDTLKTIIWPHPQKAALDLKARNERQRARATTDRVADQDPVGGEQLRRGGAATHKLAFKAYRRGEKRGAAAADARTALSDLHSRKRLSRMRKALDSVRDNSRS